MNARTNWRRKVIFSYGEAYSDYSLADQAVEGPCVKTLVGLTRCEARGRPCAPVNAAATTVTREVACGAKGDSKSCDPHTKWIQTALTQNVCKVGKIDGSPGPDTLRAVKCFQTKSKLPDTGDLTDPRVLDALAAAYKPAVR